MKAKKIFVCAECDYQSPKWLGRCPECGTWNTFNEETYTAPSPKLLTGRTSAAEDKRRGIGERDREEAVKFRDFTPPEYMRVSTQIGELDRVLGGGLVTGSAVLLSGEPGIGKSTLLMQLCGILSGTETILYVSGEESKGQLKLRADRLGADGENFYVLTATNLNHIIDEYNKIKPDIVIIDSIQTMYSESCTSTQGSVSQVRECSGAIIELAKYDSASVIIVGHVNKEGGIAGPKVLEHMVDAVLYFEGDRRQSHRIVRAIKNRYGSTNEIGVFEMTEEGLKEVPNPSAMLLEGRPLGVSGSCAVCTMEGSRPIIAEIQALASPTTFPSPRRTATGLEYNRMYMLLAVLEKRLGLKFSACDVYLNVIGGLRLDDTATDAAACLALISSLRDIPVPPDVIAFGEVGLSGEFRAVSNIEQRVNEAHRLGFTKIALPRRSLASLKNAGTLTAAGTEFIPLGGIYDAVRLLAVGEQKTSDNAPV